MTNNDFKKLLDEAIKPLKADISNMKIETTVKSYADRYVTRSHFKTPTVILSEATPEAGEAKDLIRFFGTYRLVHPSE